MLFAATWSVLQLAALGSWSRSVRVSTLLIVLATGVYGCGVLAVVLQLIWTRLLAALTPLALADIVSVAAYTLDPIIEEVVKVAPFIALALLLPRVARQLGFIDYLVLGAATGAGFALFEAVLRYGTLGSLTTRIEDGYLVQAGLFGGVVVPGITDSMTSWLPPSVGVLTIGATSPTNIGHLEWSALAALGIGWFVHRQDRLRWLGVAPLAYACLDHMHYNFVITHTPIPLLSGLISWSHTALPVVVFLVLIAAVARDRITLGRARAQHTGVLLAGENAMGLALGPLLSFAAVRPPWTSAIAARFVLARRSSLYAVARDPQALDQIGLVVDTREQMMGSQTPSQWDFAQPSLVGARTLVQSMLTRPRFIIWLLLVLPAVLYYVVGGFPWTRGVQEVLAGTAGTVLLAAISLAGLGFVAWQVWELARGWRRGLSEIVGETVIRYAVRLFAGAGALIAGLGLMGTVLLAGPDTSRVITNYHALDALGSLLLAAGFALFLWGLFMFPPLGVAALAGGGSIFVVTVTGQLVLTTAAATLLGSLGILLNQAADGSRGNSSGSGSSGGTGGTGGAPKPAAQAPRVQNGKLSNYVRDIFKGTKNPNRTGDGTTMDAIRYELRNPGGTVGGRQHVIKGRDLVRGLRRWLRGNRDASSSDREVAQRLLDELIKALGGG